jgi:hypothetical protein
MISFKNYPPELERYRKEFFEVLRTLFKLVKTLDPVETAEDGEDG